MIVVGVQRWVESLFINKSNRTKGKSIRGVRGECGSIVGLVIDKRHYFKCFM
jgi:hypothetical protein